MPICDSKPMTRLIVFYIPTNKLTGIHRKQGEHNCPKPNFAGPRPNTQISNLFGK